MSGLVEEGRAKVNLTLRVVGRRVDGYHVARLSSAYEQLEAWGLPVSDRARKVETLDQVSAVLPTDR